jgi:opacity protein-like surface antigen
MRRRRRIVCVLSASLVLFLAQPAAAQGVRGWASTQLRYLEMQPLQLDTALAGDVVYDADGNARVDGQLIWCAEAPCPYYRPVAVQDAVVGTQDIGLTAWGLGMTGLSVTVLMRGRDRVSGDLDWPLAEDPFDLMVGYAELRRGGARIRAGRQETPTGLGFRAFDGGSARYDWRNLWIEGFGGRSLARGLSEPARDALRGVEDFVRDKDAHLFGGAAGYRWGVSGIGLRYQREIWADRVGILSERASADIHTVLPLSVRLRGSVDYDIAFDRVGKANITLQRGFLGGRLMAELEARRYVPYFDLSTIWGFFSPVPFHEAGIRLNVGLSRGTGLRLGVAAREYDDPNAVTVFRPLRNRGYRAQAKAMWSPAQWAQVDAGYDLDWAAHSFLHSFDGSVATQWRPEFRTRVFGTSFQQFEAFRLGDGRAYGGGFGLEWTVTDRILLDGAISVIRQEAGRDGPNDAWSQTRASLGLRYEFGEDPGLRRRRR